MDGTRSQTLLGKRGKSHLASALGCERWLDVVWPFQYLAFEPSDPILPVRYAVGANLVTVASYFECSNSYYVVAVQFYTTS